MRTAIFVYEPMSLNIQTAENGLVLCGMTAGSVPLSEKQTTQAVQPGVYKIVSALGVSVVSDSPALDVIVEPNDKTDIPTLPPLRATTSFAAIDLAAMQAFFVVPDAKRLANP